MKRPINPENAPVRVYNEKGMAVVCVKRYPSMALTFHQLEQLHYLLGVDRHLLDTALFLNRELGDDASERLNEAISKSGIRE